MSEAVVWSHQQRGARLGQQCNGAAQVAQSSSSSLLHCMGAPSLPSPHRSSPLALAFSRSAPSSLLASLPSLAVPSPIFPLDQNECSDSRPDLCAARLLRGSQCSSHQWHPPQSPWAPRWRARSNSGKICSEEIFVLSQEMNCLWTGSGSLGRWASTTVMVVYTPHFGRASNTTCLPRQFPSPLVRRFFSKLCSLSCIVIPPLSPPLPPRHQTRCVLVLWFRRP